MEGEAERLSRARRNIFCLTAVVGRPGGAEDTRGTRSMTRYDEHLLEEIEGLKSHIRQLESRVDSLTSRGKPRGEPIRTAIEGFEEALECGIPKGNGEIVGGPRGTRDHSLS